MIDNISTHSNKLITVFTPTYNRSTLLLEVYKSLLAQTFKDFKWLIISDGSNDGTSALVEKIKEENRIDIEYIWQENQGKISTIKKAFAACNTKYLVDLDDDDTLFPDALETFINTWEEIEKEENHNIGQVRALTVYENGDVVGGKKSDIGLPSIDSSYLEMQVARKYKFENCTCWLASTFKGFDFLQFDNTWMKKDIHFVGECVFWSRYSRRYKSRYIFRPVRIYGMSPDSIFRAKTNPLKKWTHMAYTNLLMINENSDYLQKNIFSYIHRHICYLTYSKSAGICSYNDSMKQFKHKKSKILSIILYPAIFLISNYLIKVTYKECFS